MPDQFSASFDGKSHCEFNGVQAVYRLLQNQRIVPASQLFEWV